MAGTGRSCAGCAGFGTIRAFPGTNRDFGGLPNMRYCEETVACEVFYGEFDGRRRKRVLIKIIGE